MSVLQFGFTPGEEHTVHVPENNSEDQVVYTGTHDSDTIRGWYESITPEQRARVTATLARFGISDPEMHWALIRLVFASPAVIAMIPLLFAGQSLIRIARDEMKSAANDQLVTTVREVTGQIDDIYERAWLPPGTTRIAAGRSASPCSHRTPARPRRR